MMCYVCFLHVCVCVCVLYFADQRPVHWFTSSGLAAKATTANTVCVVLKPIVHMVSLSKQ